MSGYIFGAFYDITRRIPAGKVATYGQIARLAGMPRCARTVGYAMAACRDPSIPCHRVVDRFGGTKSCFDLHAPGTQRALLEVLPFFLSYIYPISIFVLVHCKDIFLPTPYRS